MSSPNPYAPIDVIRARLQTARRAVGFSQAELARRAGVKQSQVSKLEGQQSLQPQMTTILALCTALGLPLEACCANDEKVFLHALNKLETVEPSAAKDAAVGLPPLLSLDLVPLHGRTVALGTNMFSTRTGAAVIAVRPRISGDMNALAELIRRSCKPARLLLNRAAPNEPVQATFLLPNDSLTADTITKLDGSLCRPEQVLLASDAALQLTTEQAIVQAGRSWAGVDLRAPNPITEALRDEESELALARLLAPHSAVFAHDHMEVTGEAGRRRARGFVVKPTPSGTQPGWLQHIITPNGNVRVAVDIHPVDISSWVRHTRALLARDAALDRDDPRAMSDSDRERTEATLTGVEQDITRIVNTYLTVLVCGSTREEMEEQSLAFKREDSLIIRRADLLQQDMYQAGLIDLPAVTPGRSKTAFSSTLMTGAELSMFLPSTGPSHNQL